MHLCTYLYMCMHMCISTRTHSAHDAHATHASAGVRGPGDACKPACNLRMCAYMCTHTCIRPHAQQSLRAK